MPGTKRSRKAQLSLARAKKTHPPKSTSSPVPAPASDPEVPPQPPVPGTPINDPLEELIPTQMSASKRKLEYFADNQQLHEDAMFQTFVVDFTLLQSLVQPLSCPQCCQQSITLRTDNTQNLGFVRKLLIDCTTCGEVVSSSFTSNRLPDKCFELNRRAVAASVAMGVGHEGLSKFCEVMNLPTLHHKTYSSHINAISTKVPDFKRRVLDLAAEKVKAAYPPTEGVLDIDVSYDGSWQTRGHTSMSGLGCAIEQKTGLVVDYHTMSRYCYVCSTTGQTIKKRSEELYNTWYAAHQPSCDQNHHGTAGSMEQKGAVELWGRSVEVQGMRYRSILSDGDANTIKELHKLDPYPGLTIEKLECINHVAKRVYKALSNLVNDRKKQGVTLGGRGQGTLTQDKMKVLQKYYRKAIQTHNDVPSMKAAIWATVEHSTSTDEKPQHDKCPKGPKSYCFYQRALAKGLPPPNHSSSTYLNPKVAQETIPVYTRLTDDDLLRRCLLGKTQNVNESIHSVIWARCPKHVFVRKQRLDIAVCLGVAEFNMGSLATRLFMDSVGLRAGKETTKLGSRRDNKRTYVAEREVTETAKKRRAIIRNAVAAEEQRLQDEEGGPQYEAGAF